MYRKSSAIGILHLWGGGEAGNTAQARVDMGRGGGGGGERGGGGGGGDWRKSCADWDWCERGFSSPSRAAELCRRL